jgi:hypothetical protein
MAGGLINVTKRPPRRKRAITIVESEHHAPDQNDEIVGNCRRMALMHRKPA